MGQRFHFDLTNGEELIRDTEGIDANSANEAIEEAQAALAEMRGNEGVPASGDGWQLVIRDENGMTLRALSLNDGAPQAPTALNHVMPLRALHHGLKDRFHNSGAIIFASQYLI